MGIWEYTSERRVFITDDDSKAWGKGELSKFPESLKDFGWNELGKKGWELVQILPSDDPEGIDKREIGFFKRRLPD